MTNNIVGIIASMQTKSKTRHKAKLVLSSKEYYPDGGLIELVVWHVPQPVPPTTHGFKYRLVYIRDGVRVVGFDNERGKGDHMHLDGQERPYAFVSVPQLIEDFIAQVDKRRAS